MSNPLYLPEKEIAILVLGKERAPEWPVLMLAFERLGMPKIDPLTGMRYWPAIQRWFDTYNRIENIKPRNGGGIWTDANLKPLASSGSRAKRGRRSPSL
jgi:hypothetical protein